MVSAKDALTNKVFEITAHHDSYQQKTDERLDILCEKLSTIAKNANALITDSSFNVSSDISGGTSNDPESIRASDLDSASRTLGFFPVTSTDSSNAAAAFMAFLMSKLQIPKGIVITIKAKQLWYNEKKSMLFAELLSKDMCHIIFRHMRNMKGIERIEKYIHPSLRDLHRELTTEAFKLRQEHNYYKTRIDYTRDSLTLLVKATESFPWTQFSPENAENHEFHETSNPISRFYKLTVKSK